LSRKLQALCGSGGAKVYAAAQRTLDLLNWLPMQMLEGETNADALEALSNTAIARSCGGG